MLQPRWKTCHCMCHRVFYSLSFTKSSIKKTNYLQPHQLNSVLTRNIWTCTVLCGKTNKKENFKTLYHKKIGLLNLHEKSEAEDFVKNLKKPERLSLLLELQKYHLDSTNGNQNGNAETTVTREQLKTLFLFNCTPFIGFGFLDNAIMILAGDYIDQHIGIALGISTMAAAALGNLVSDLFGIGLAGYVEMLCSKLGLPVPDLTPEQMDMTSSRVYSHLGKAVGITIGCIIGMFPLLFLRKKEDEENT
uniref:Transmembrane protein 65-like n=1 Tax=Phallusia mammillata TaxID=59560 RepID=A0A6F9DUL2_9ASCI|nr:transmembrane protein 65-like [Phallusia mammillata]